MGREAAATATERLGEIVGVLWGAPTCLRACPTCDRRARRRNRWRCDGPGRAAKEQAAVLTPRELEVLGLVGAGLSNAEIAARLYLVEGTVKAYVSSVLLRLAVKNRVQAAIVAYEAGLVTS